MTGAVWIEGGTFMMGSDEFYPEERPAHRGALVPGRDSRSVRAPSKSRRPLDLVRCPASQ